MIENQLISKMIEDKDISILKEYQIEPKNFLTSRDQIEFILDYNMKYKSVPSYATMIKEFPDYPLVDVESDIQYLAHQLKETYLYTELVPVLQDASKVLKTDSEEALQLLKEHIVTLTQEHNSQTGVGVDIIKNSETRLEDYKKRVEMEGLLGISTGIKQLDTILHGWLPEDLITIFARTSEGKSWIALYFMVQAWLQGKKVLLYSGEMSPLIVGYRVDSYLGHFSNMGLMSGNAKEQQEYKDFINDLKEKEGFIVVTQKDVGNKRPTVQDIEELIDYHKPDIVGIDQITLMDDWRRADNTRNRYGNISSDLYSLSESKQIPIIAVTQANREVAKKNEQKENPEAPKLHEISESDQIAHNSTRVIALARVDNIMKLVIEKNRFGVGGQEILLNWKIDKGYIEPLLDDELITADDYGF